jgi:hypothetical protein
MERSTALLSNNLSTSQYLFVAAIVVLMLFVIASQLATQKQKKLQRDASLDQYIISEYKKRLLALLRHPFRYPVVSSDRKK